jgi:hypothetical protein
MLYGIGRLFGSMLVVLYAEATLSETPAVAQQAAAFPANRSSASGEAQAGGNSGILIRQARLSCTAPPRSNEPFDPPTTSALSVADSFAVREHFRLDTSPAADVGISWLGATFAQRYGGKVESRVADAPLQVFTLGRASRDAEIVGALGDRLETQLGAIWCSLRLQAHGEPGALLTTAVPNIFYARDAAGVLGAVDVVWGGAGWEIGASRIDGGRQWPAGIRVFSRD